MSEELLLRSVPARRGLSPAWRWRAPWLLAALVLVVVGWAVCDQVTASSPWRRTQAAYRALQIERGERPIEIGLREVTVPALGVADRCTSCHLGIDQPQWDSADVPKVFRTHPRRAELLGKLPLPLPSPWPWPRATILRSPTTSSR